MICSSTRVLEEKSSKPKSSRHKGPNEQAWQANNFKRRAPQRINPPSQELEGRSPQEQCLEISLLLCLVEESERPTQAHSRQDKEALQARSSNKESLNTPLACPLAPSACWGAPLRCGAHCSSFLAAPCIDPLWQVASIGCSQK